MTHLFEGVRQPKDAGSYEGDEDVGENLNTTVCTVIVHRLTPPPLYGYNDIARKFILIHAHQVCFI